MNKESRVYIAGHQGLLGAGLVRKFKKDGYNNLILRTKSELDLRNRDEVMRLFDDNKPEYVFIAAAKVGGIMANVTYPTDFILDNLKIQNNILEACLSSGVKKTMFPGSSCVYPKYSPQPMKEEYFLNGLLEPTNEYYAIAKIAGIKLSQAMNKEHGLKVVCPMPCNIYGQGDHYEFERAHVISALVRRFSEAKKRGDKSITLWGTGKASREFLYVDDCVDGIIFIMDNFDSSDIINVGYGKDFTIKEIAEKIASIVDYNGEILWDSSKPDGMDRKLLDSSKLDELGWKPKISIDEGIRMVLEDYNRWSRL